MKKNKKFYIVCSLAIGDGCLRQRRNTEKAELDIAHHIKHQDYIEYKARIMRDVGMRTNGMIKNRVGNTQYRVYSNSTYLNYCVYRKLYDNKQKIFTNGMLKNLDKWSLAILWMDDGCLSFRKSKRKDGSIYRYKFGSIATNSFNKENNEKILKWLEKFEITGYLRKDNRFSEENKYSIVFNRDNVNKLIEIVSPIVKNIPSMKYKIRD
uniref:Putative homing endonuclease n=1 Tax=viral metagenome TaxID=1070528 RepID=A0A6H1ZL89_9ZZZZ